MAGGCQCSADRSPFSGLTPGYIVHDVVYLVMPAMSSYHTDSDKDSRFSSPDDCRSIMAVSVSGCPGLMNNGRDSNYCSRQSGSSGDKLLSNFYASNSQNVTRGMMILA